MAKLFYKDGQQMLDLQVVTVTLHRELSQKEDESVTLTSVAVARSSGNVQERPWHQIKLM